MYANRITRTETDDNGDEKQHEIPCMKGYNVFNADQCDGLPAYFSTPIEAPALSQIDCIEQADRILIAAGANIHHGGTQAYYVAYSNHVQMPPFETFRDAESRAAILAHELTHWTKHPTRLARNFGRKQFGDEGQAREELVAELGSAFL